MRQQVGGIVGAVKPTSTAISTEHFATVGVGCYEGDDASLTMERAVPCHSRVCNVVEHKKYPTKPLDPQPEG